MKLSNRIFIFILEFALIPLIFFSFIVYTNNKIQVERSILEKLDSIAQTQKNRLLDVLDQKNDLLSLFTTKPQLHSSLNDYNLHPSPILQKTLNDLVVEAKAGSDNIKEIFVIDPSGRMVASTGVLDPTKDLSHEDYFILGLKQNDVSLVKKDSSDRLVQYLVGPVTLNGQTLGVVVLITDAKEITSLAGDFTGLGLTGETLLVKNDGRGNALFITPIRFDKNAGLNRVVPKESSDVPATHANAGEESVFDNLVDYRKVPVFSATRYLVNVHWGIVVKIDKAEALSPIFKLGQLYIFLLLSTSILVIALSIQVSRAIVAVEEELSDQRNEFISLASHQLKTPIINISWGLESILDDDKTLKPETREMLENILKSNKETLELVTGFLDITKMEAGKYSVEKGDTDLIEISDNVLSELNAQISKKEITVVKKYGDNVPHLKIGDNTAKVILQNLLTNAVKYTPAKGTVEVDIVKVQGGISVSVKDNGYGIPEEAKSHIFSKLYRAENAKEKDPTGTGLGLYLVKKLIDRLNGKIWFESIEGVGTTFHVFLPG